jgi:hypothetical protein
MVSKLAVDDTGNRSLNLPLLRFCDRTGQTTNKPENDFDRYHKYLTEYAGIDLTSVEDSRNRINSLRKVRNRLIHHGGDIPSNEEDEYSCIDGITVMSLPPIHYLVIEDDFIWDMGEHVQKYLHKAVIS